MKRYNVKVNGKTYEVELEAVEEFSGKAEKKVEAAPAAKETASGGSKEVLAPIAGKVLSINVNVGDVIEKDQTVMVVEAMKLENEIRAPFAGKVAMIKVAVGDDVRSKDVLMVLE